MGKVKLWAALIVCTQGLPAPPTPCGLGEDFESIAYTAGTDKVKAHNYAPIYERFLELLRCTSFNFLEWGFAAGASARAWREYLPLAKISEIEIGCFPHSPWYKQQVATKYPHQKWIAGQVPNARLYCGNAVNFTWVAESALMQHVGPLRVVIDDGGHSREEMALSFFYYFARIVPGGLFFMEDLGTSYFRDKTMTKGGFVEGVIKPLLDDLNRDVNSQDTMTRPPAFPELLGMVKSVSCETQICVIERSNLPSFDMPASTATAMWARVSRLLPRAELSSKEADDEKRRQTQSNEERHARLQARNMASSKGHGKGHGKAPAIAPAARQKAHLQG